MERIFLCFSILVGYSALCEYAVQASLQLEMTKKGGKK